MSDSANGRTFGLLAGGGELPVEFIRHAKEYGLDRIIAIGLKEWTDPEIARSAAYYEELKLGQLGRLVKIFKQHGVTGCVMLGRVAPKLAVTDIPLDFRLLKLATKFIDRRANGIFGVIADDLLSDGIVFEDTTRYLKHLLAPVDTITRKKPDAKQLIDIRFGMEIALALGGLDVGQTAVVYKHAVIAAEAMEGTDECIRRAGKYTSHGVVVKMAKPKQDFRFDVPCVGVGTIESMIEAKAAVLAVEAGKTFLLQRQKTIELADRHGIVVTGIAGN